MYHNNECKMAATNTYVEYANKAVVDKLYKMNYTQFLKMNKLYYDEKDDAKDFETKKEADAPYAQMIIALKRLIIDVAEKNADAMLLENHFSDFGKFTEMLFFVKTQLILI